MAKKVTSKNLAQVMLRLHAFAEDEPARMVEVVSKFNQFLNDLDKDDFFGTEGQCDPRGDRRNEYMRSRDLKSLLEHIADAYAVGDVDPVGTRELVLEHLKKMKLDAERLQKGRAFIELMDGDY